MTTAQVVHRPSESIADGRRWSFGRHEFSTFITVMGVVIPSELDLVELGVRPAMAFTEQVANSVRHWYGDQFRVLHPAEHSSDSPKEAP